MSTPTNYTLSDFENNAQANYAEAFAYLPAISRYTFQQFPFPVNGQGYAGEDLLFVGTSSYSIKRPTQIWARCVGSDFEFYIQRSATDPLKLLVGVAANHVKFVAPVCHIHDGQAGGGKQRQMYRARRKVLLLYIFLKAGKINQINNVNRDDMLEQFARACRDIQREAINPTVFKPRKPCKSRQTKKNEVEQDEEEEVQEEPKTTPSESEEITEASTSESSNSDGEEPTVPKNSVSESAKPSKKRRHVCEEEGSGVTPVKRKLLPYPPILTPFRTRAKHTNHNPI
jgi:hypothetical protein